MQIASREQGDVIVFELQGRVDSNGAGQMDDALQNAITENHYQIILDMSDVSYINSAGLRTLADILTKCQANDGSLKLVALGPKVERVLKIIGFDKFFMLYDTVDEAAADF